MRSTGVLGGRTARLAMAVLAVTVLAVSCGGSDDEEVGTTGTTAAGAEPGTPAAGASTTSTTKAVPRSAPRWETVTTLNGSGKQTTDAFAILDDAIQWRVRWNCNAPGAMKITSDPPPRKGRPVAEGACPGQGEGFGIHTGSIRLIVETSGAWGVTVDQQVDTPLLEDPVEGMTSEALVGEGAFVNVEMTGTGTARLYELPGGKRYVRLEPDFQVSNNTDLFLWLSEAEAPKTSKEAADTPHVQLGNLKSTLGSQNYLVPSNLPTEKVRSIVIWCAPVAIAYAAAPLART